MLKKERMCYYLRLDMNLGHALERAPEGPPDEDQDEELFDEDHLWKVHSFMMDQSLSSIDYIVEKIALTLFYQHN